MEFLKNIKSFGFHIIVLLWAITTWSKEEKKSLTFFDPIPTCSRMISWRNVIQNLNLKEIECLNETSPITRDSLIQNDLNSVGIIEINKEKVVNLLKHSKRICLNEYELTLPAMIRMETQIKVTEKLFSEWIKSQISSQFLGSEIEITRVQIPATFCDGTTNMSLNNFQMVGKNSFRFNFLLDEKNVAVNGEFKLFQSVPVALKNLLPNEKIEKSDIENQRKDVTFSSGLVMNINELNGQILGYPVLQGEPIPRRSLKPEKMIERGQMVTIQFQGENIYVSSSGIAEQSGVLGDLIRVKNIETQKIISGIISSKGTVEIR